MIAVTRGIILRHFQRSWPLPGRLLNIWEKKDWDVAIRQIVNGETHYEVEIDRHTGNPTDKVVADAPTAPLAICTAALRASDYQEELPQ
jgi:hypothetical protein